MKNGPSAFTTVPSIFVETVVINYFPYSFRLCSHFSDSSCAHTKNYMFTRNSDSANLKVDRHITGKFLGQTSSALDKIGCFPDNIIHCISCQLGLWSGRQTEKNFLDNVYEYSSDRQECKTFRTFWARIPWLIYWWTVFCQIYWEAATCRLSLRILFFLSHNFTLSLDVFITLITSTSLLLMPHLATMSSCIHYSNYVYKSTFNATPGYNVIMYSLL